MQNTQIMDIVCDLLEEQQQNSIDCYEYDGIDLTLTEPIRMQSTILLTLFTVSKLLGHSSVNTTEKYYVDLLDENFYNSVGKLSELI